MWNECKDTPSRIQSCTWENQICTPLAGDDRRLTLLKRGCANSVVGLELADLGDFSAFGPEIAKPETPGFHKSPPPPSQKPLQDPKKPSSPCLGMYRSAYYYGERSAVASFGGREGWQFMKTRGSPWSPLLPASGLDLLIGKRLMPPCLNFGP